MKIPTGKLVLAWMASVALVGCASIGPPEPPSLELPKPPTDLHARRKGDKVTLTWSIPERTTDRQSVRYLGKTRICRSLDPVLVKCVDPVSEVDPPPDFRKKSAAGSKQAANYEGSLSAGLKLDPNGSAFSTVTYAVEVLNVDGRGAGLSNQVFVNLVAALPPPTDFTARLTGQGVVLTWTGTPLPVPYPQPIRRLYRVFRRQEDSQQQTQVGEVEAGTAGDFTLTDQGFEWQKTYFYHSDTLTVVAQPGKQDVSIEGDDTPEVKVFANDVFPPVVPSGLQAVFSGPGQEAFIDLVWSPVMDADLAGYTVYRHEDSGEPVKLNAALVGTPAFRDVNVAPGKRYFYSVSAVDQRGNESKRSEEAEESVP